MKANVGKCLGSLALSAALLLVSGISALAKNARTLTIPHDIVLNGTNLPAGQYTVRWDNHSPEATIEFLKHHQVVLSTAAIIEDRPKNYDRNVVVNAQTRLDDRTNHYYDRDTLVYDTSANGPRSLVEIHFAGWSMDKVLVFDNDNSTAKAAR